MPKIEKIFPECIRLDGGTQPRAKINQQICDEYGEQMKAGEKFPPVDVFFDGENYWLADGFHRFQAYVMAVPGEAIDCNLYQGTLADAQWHSYGVNKAHGLRRTPKDLERAVRETLGHPKCQGLSDASVAKHVGVHRNTVLKVRREIDKEQSDLHTVCKSKDSPPPSVASKSRPRKGRDGRTINTAKIGEKQRRKPRRPRSAAEYHEAKQNGQKVRRPGSMVKLELPNNNTTNCAYDLLRYFTFEYLQKVFSEIVRLNQERLTKE